MPTNTGVFDRSDFADDTAHEQVVFCRDERSGLKAIIAIHSTALGPSLGGTRFYPYPDEGAALTDVLRLSRGMTYKAAIAGLGLGGGKSVIIGDPKRVKTPDLLEAHGRFVESLGGRYITAGDVGTTSEDMDVIGRRTKHVAAKTPAHGGSGDSAPLTALGVFHSIVAAAEAVWGSGDLHGRRVGVEGTGKVGYQLVRLLTDAGAGVSVCDVDAAALDRVRSEFDGVTVVDRVIDAPVDVYAPCALGATLTEDSVPSITARVVCGAANNQLSHDGVEKLLHDCGITWVPDYVANGGGLIQIAGEIAGSTREQSAARVVEIGDTVREILDRKTRLDVLAGQATRDIVRERMRAAGTGT
ncbi:valine dehydrogenase [Mycolicibacterium mageritense DSM 44476 = CIP 104973]|uniref:Valine dehydrogenase n=1 Tax=Mycolicibacterium mageritense TaxID=53462 RepID=A0ABM7HMT1_MYCME|nr:Glu/Leu/Phe/Val dehydrogenase dimerization domain-containing protein [Mycolicibacterium mageritense]BBX31825.1 valine dehydrogenase [Mycolicibacterium mageritense]CDO23627.1 glutamate dehydrogenase [Mycolicibacterium mageritense DSM 44476 = CIP 104973]